MISLAAIINGAIKCSQPVYRPAQQRLNDYRWDVSFWAKNLFDEEATTFQQGDDQYDIAFTSGSYTQTNVLAERIIGITGRYNF